MPELEDWGVIELNPMMWLTIWRKYIDDYIDNKYVAQQSTKYDNPERSTSYIVLDTDKYSPEKKKKKRKLNQTRRNLVKELNVC